MTLPISDGAVVITSISGPNAVLQSIAAGSLTHRVPFFVIGDSKSPEGFSLKGCDYYSVARQRTLPYAFAKICPERTYARKNIGYLAAMAAGARFIVETDDDNFPREEFWEGRNPSVAAHCISAPGWLNAYHYFSDSPIYPRGLPLEYVRPPGHVFPDRKEISSHHCAIQQGLADSNPDVDAIYRMLFPLPLDFRRDEPLVLASGTWCPFNSQNTTTFREAFPLLYLPTYCSFRMTDIWRSFVAQRIGWTCGWTISFHNATVYQERNEHNLLRDFADEVPGYLNNAKIAESFNSLDLAPGEANIEANMRRCYQCLIDLKLVDPRENDLLDAWFADLKQLGSVRPS